MRPSLPERFAVTIRYKDQSDAFRASFYPGVRLDEPTTIGDFCSITHHATVHGCVIGDHCLVGVGAVIMDGAVIGRGSIVAGGACVTEGSVFPEHSIVAGVPATQIGERDCARPNRLNAWLYHRNAERTRAGDERASARRCGGRARR